MIPTWGQQRGGATLSLDFINNDSVLDSRITFTRASTATYYDSTGTLQTAAINAPRFDYNPSTLAARGLLIEEARTNSVVQSANFGTTWVTTSLGSVTVDATASPSGATDADLFNEGTATSTHAATQTISTTAASTYTISCFFKNISRQWVGLAVSTTTTAYASAKFDILNGVVGSTSATGTGYSIVSSSITTLPNGWYRCSLTFVAGSTSASAVARVFMATDGTTFTASNAGMESYTGTSKQIYAWGAQFELGAFATSYIPTTTAAATRSADLATMTGTNFSSWYNQSQGTFVTQFVWEGLKTVAGQRVITTDDGTTTNQMQQGAGSSNALLTTLTTAGATEVNTSTPATTFVAGTVYKSALAYATNNTVAALNGTIGTTDTVCAMPTALTTFRFSPNASTPTVVNANVWFASLKFYPIRLPDGTLQGLTA